MPKPNFGNILNKPASQIERPKAIPIGNYIWLVQGLPRQDVSARKQTPFYEYTVKPLQATEDVDQEALDEALSRKDGTKKALGDFTQRLTFYITENSAYRLPEFLKHCGLDVTDDEVTVEQLAQQAGGCQFLGTIGHTPSEDGENVYANIVRTAAVD